MSIALMLISSEVLTWIIMIEHKWGDFNSALFILFEFQKTWTVSGYLMGKDMIKLKMKVCFD